MNYQTSLLLSYLLIALSYFFGNEIIRLLLFPLVLGISWLSINSLIKTKKVKLKELKSFRFFFVLFVLTFFIQLLNDNLIPFIIYIPSMFCISLLLLKGNIQIKYIKIPSYIFAFLCLIVLGIRGSIYNIFPSMSVNYVSVVFIMNTIVILMLEKRNNEPISTLPAFLGMFFSLVGLGRSGIICMAILFVYIIYLGWNQTTRRTKTLYFIFLIVPVILFCLYESDVIVDKIENLSILERFQERGIDSPSRDILKREYLKNMTQQNIILGYNYQNNYQFLHYGLNPHNSYIRLHYYFGILFFVIVPILFIALVKLFRKNFTYFICLVAILLRSWTDTVIFLLLYDFILIALVYSAFSNNTYENKSSNTERIK